MSVDNALLEELSELVVIYTSGAANDAQFARLEQLLDASEEARVFYVDSLDMHANLCGYCRQPREKMEDGLGDTRFRVEDAVGGRPFGPDFSIPNSAINDQSSASPSPLPSFLGAALYGTVGHFSSGWPAAYLVATVIFGIGLLVGSLVHVSQPTQVARQSSVPSWVDAEPRMEPVGRITGMVDCRWADQATEASNGAHVPLGRKYLLASGLMEITYDTGAKVILQGPAAYEVESKAGGYLSLGKLTTRVERQGARDAGAANPKSEIRNPKFVVRTPSATVSDLGTEFGVDVDSHGASHVATFVGLVRVTLTKGSQSNRSQSLAAGEAVRVDASGSMVETSLKTIHFVRNLRQETLGLYAKAVLDDHPLAYWPLNETPGARRIADHLRNGCDGRLVGAVRLGQRGPLSSDRSRAAEFTGDGYIEVTQLPNSDPAKGFSIEAWARVDGEIMLNGQRECRSVIMYRDLNEGSNSKGFYLYAGNTNTWDFWTGIDNVGRTGDVWDRMAGPAIVKGQWTHVVGTFAPTGAKVGGALVGVKSLYINGNLVATGTQRFAPNEWKPLRIGAGLTEAPTASPLAFFVGRIAEVAVYDRPLTKDRVLAHWEASKCPDTGKGTAP